MNTSAFLNTSFINSLATDDSLVGNDWIDMKNVDMRIAGVYAILAAIFIITIYSDFNRKEISKLSIDLAKLQASTLVHQYVYEGFMDKLKEVHAARLIRDDVRTKHASNRKDADLILLRTKSQNMYRKAKNTLTAHILETYKPLYANIKVSDE
jgi:hypothetical protein